ncbi:hypothetical protein FXV91_13465 [Methanosarcina sp. DH2]|jgi:hypothetical protein|uniref:hypothetical protein n=1 Tax=Methanosarcina sp. DH2 TaxID=2605639 RepID=UPI001E3D7ECB|nr:hypothetical protein [Methanosarcina sp. DH2]MCC4771135.1 hypothetical protein [Methanosarcina sp. DH2]
MIDKGEKKMFSVTIGNYGIVKINRLPENATEYNQIIDAREGKESFIIDKSIKVFDVRNGELDNDLIPVSEEKNGPSRPEWRFISDFCFPIYDESNNYLGYYEMENFIRSVKK